MAGSGVAQFLTGAADVVCLGNLTGTNNLAAAGCMATGLWAVGKKERQAKSLDTVSYRYGTDTGIITCPIY